MRKVNDGCLNLNEFPSDKNCSWSKIISTGFSSGTQSKILSKMSSASEFWSSPGGFIITTSRVSEVKLFICLIKLWKKHDSFLEASQNCSKSKTRTALDNILNDFVSNAIKWKRIYFIHAMKHPFTEYSRDCSTMMAEWFGDDDWFPSGPGNWRKTKGCSVASLVRVLWREDLAL